MDLSDTQRMVIDEKDLAAEDGESTKLCEGCDWHFALRVSSAGSDTSRLVWGLYRQDVDGSEYTHRLVKGPFSAKYHLS